MAVLAKDAVMSLWIVEEVVVNYVTGYSQTPMPPTCPHRMEGSAEFPPEPTLAQQTWYQYFRAVLVGAELSSFCWMALLLRHRQPRAGGVGG